MCACVYRYIYRYIVSWAFPSLRRAVDGDAEACGFEGLSGKDVTCLCKYCHRVEFLKTNKQSRSGHRILPQEHANKCKMSKSKLVRTYLVTEVYKGAIPPFGQDYWLRLLPFQTATFRNFSGVWRRNTVLQGERKGTPTQHCYSHCMSDGQQASLLVILDFYSCSTVEM